LRQIEVIEKIEKQGQIKYKKEKCKEEKKQKGSDRSIHGFSM
jgi:hypothetical protein